MAAGFQVNAHPLANCLAPVNISALLSAVADAYDLAVITCTAATCNQFVDVGIHGASSSVANLLGLPAMLSTATIVFAERLGLGW